MLRVLVASLFIWFVFLAVVLMLTGCDSKDLAPKVAAVVNSYCTEPQAERLLLRQRVNALIAPNTIAVTCQGDVS